MNPRDESSALSALGEFGLIERLSGILSQKSSSEGLGIGDDAAVLTFGDSTLLVTTDALLEGVHFRLDWTSPEDLGWKALAVNLSDIAAMGGVPRAAFLSLGLPSSISLEWVERFYLGMDELSRKAACPVMGGDTVASPDRVYLNVTVLGDSPEGGYATRSGARPGDALLVTGTLGDSLAGYYCLIKQLRDGSPSVAHCLNAHRRPQPRLEAGQLASKTGRVHAMMDLSDGLSGDVRHIADQSSVGVQVWEKALPISREMREVAERLGKSAEEMALAGGEDYELLLAVAPEDVDAVQEAFASAGVLLTVIGTVTESQFGLNLINMKDKEIPLPRLSWDHFSSQEN